MDSPKNQEVNYEFDGSDPYANLPPDLGGFQQLVHGELKIGDLAVVNGKPSYWVQGLAGLHVEDEDWQSSHDNLRFYRRIPVANHKDTASPETKALIAETEAKQRSASPDDVLAAVRAERGKVYGDPQLSHANIGLSWTGLIQQHYGIVLDHPLPAWLVSLMMVVFKAQRASRVYHEDNYVDAANYAKFAQDGQKTDPKAQLPAV